MSTISSVVDSPVGVDFDSITVGLDNKLVDFASEKTKVFFEALANISFYFSKIPALDSRVWSTSEKAFGSLKTAMSLPSFIKGASSFYKNYNAGKLFFKKGLADFAYVVSDGIDSIKTISSFGVITLSDGFKTTIDKAKTLAGLIGLTKSIEDCYSDIQKAKATDPGAVVAANPKNQSLAVEVKKRWAASELHAKEYDMLKNVTGYVLCVLSLTTGFEPWKFAMLGTVGLVGKFMNYYHKVDATFWENKFVEVSR